MYRCRYHSRSIDRRQIPRLDWLPLSPFHMNFLVGCNGIISIENYGTSHQATLTYQVTLLARPRMVPAAHVVQKLQVSTATAQQPQYPALFSPNGLVSENV